MNALSLPLLVACVVVGCVPTDLEAMADRPSSPPSGILPPDSCGPRDLGDCAGHFAACMMAFATAPGEPEHLTVRLDNPLCFACLDVCKLTGQWPDHVVAGPGITVTCDYWAEDRFRFGQDQGVN